MPQVDQIQIGATVYDILQSDNATFTGTSNDASSATSWTNVDVLASSETNGSIFTKISSMFKNIRYLYSKLGNTDISGVGSSVTAAIAALNTGKAAVNHTHDTSSLKTADGQSLISNTQTNATNRAASAKLVYDMNTILTSINDERSKYVTKLGISNNSTITLYHNNTSVSSGTLTTATSAAIGLLPKLANTTAKCLLGNGTWGQAGSTYANVSTAAPGLMPKLNNNANYYINGTGNWSVPTGTTYSFSNKSATLAWNTQSTIAVCGGTNITVKMPAAPTTYGTFTSAANGLVPAAKSGTTNYATANYVLTGAGWKAGTKYNADTTYGTNVGCYGTLNGTTLTLNTRNFRV